MEFPEYCLKCKVPLFVSKSKEPIKCHICNMIYWIKPFDHDRYSKLYAIDFYVDGHRIVNFYDDKVSIIDYNVRKIRLDHLIPLDLTKKQLNLYLKFY